MPLPWEEDWSVGEKFQSGGQGQTLKVWNKHDPSLLAVVKTLKNNRSEQARKRMHREVACLQTLADSPCRVPKVLSHNTDKFADHSTLLYVVMEYVNGPTLLEQVAGSGVLRISDAITLAMKLSGYISYGHSLGIVHRDIKPANIVLANGDVCQPVLIDYGVSFDKSDDRQITEVGDRIGNGFMDLPELASPTGSKQDARTDVAQVCGILFYCICGDRIGQLADGVNGAPHKRSNFQKATAQLSASTRSALARLFDRGFDPVLDNRPGDAAELAALLEMISQADEAKGVRTPSQTAKLYEPIIRKLNRPGQLVEMKPLADALHNACKEHYQQLKAISPAILFEQPAGVQINPKDIPPGCDRVLDHAFRYTVGIVHSSLRLYRYVVILAMGDQCVVCTADMPFSRENQHTQRHTMPSGMVLREAYRAVTIGDAKSDLLKSLVDDWVAAAIPTLVEKLEETLPRST